MDTPNSLPIIKVQIIDPHQVAILGITHLVSTKNSMKVCGLATNKKDALSIASNSEADIIILDPHLEDDTGLEIIPTLQKASKAKIIIYSSNSTSVLNDQAIVLGARGIVLKSESTDNLLLAIEKIHLGELWLNRSATSRILMQIASMNATKELSPQEKRLATLSAKEEKVARAIQMEAEKKLKEIAASLNISEHTLRNHLASIYDKLELKNRLDLYVFCGKYLKTTNPLEHPKRRAGDI